MHPARPQGPTATDTIEEAVHLLRGSPLSFFTPYLVGMMPYALGLLWFTAEMTWSAFASERLIDASFIVALLFVWKQCWEAVFCASMHDRLTGSEPQPWTSKRIFHMVSMQCAMQPLSLLAIPLAALTMLPFAWAVAFFRNLSLFAAPGGVRRAAHQAGLWTRANWTAHAYLGLIAAILFVNYFAALFLLPQLGKSFLGIDNAVTRYPTWLMTSTGFAAVCILVYVTLDPVFSAFYVLRCFYGQSTQSGDDLRARFRRLASVSALLGFLLLAPAVSRLEAQTPTVVDAKRIERSMDTVMRRREYTWRMPRTNDAAADKRPGWATWIDRMSTRMGEWWRWFLEGLRKLFMPGDRDGEGKNGNAGVWDVALQYTLWILGAVFAIGAAVLFYRQRNANKAAVGVTAAVAVPLALDLHDESLTADKLPESSWMSLAQEWIDKGDLRLALRAMHLAGLSYLNGRSLVTIQRWKTGMDYSAELGRRARTAPEVASAFRSNVRIFEAGWYGRHEVSRGSLEAFSRGLDELRSYAERI